jgi:type I site-specific restriction-modification system R (restriction) subunit
LSPGSGEGQSRSVEIAIVETSFLGFTGTPIEPQDADTRAAFGDYISVYDIQRAVQDGATVPICYGSPLAELALDQTERPKPRLLTRRTGSGISATSPGVRRGAPATGYVPNRPHRDLPVREARPPSRGGR